VDKKKPGRSAKLKTTFAIPRKTSWGGKKKKKVKRKGLGLWGISLSCCVNSARMSDWYPCAKRKVTGRKAKLICRWNSIEPKTKAGEGKGG